MSALPWRSFRIGDLFDVAKGTRLTKAEMTCGDTPFIGASSKANGVTARIGNVGRLHPAGSITVCYNGSVGESFYQPEPFWASDDVNVLVPREPVDGAALMFLLPLLRKTGQRYGYADKWCRDAMLDDEVMLPVTAEGSPDWEAMGGYMERVLDEAQRRVEALASMEGRRRVVDSSSWRPFPIGSLFVVQKGTRLTRADMIPGDTPFIGASLENNGVTARVGNSEHIHPGGLITVAYNGQKAAGKAFWQPAPFWASDDVNVLYPKFEMDEAVALFLLPIIWEAGRPYSFGDKWSREAMERTDLLLPACEGGEPDWAYMGGYMDRMLSAAGNAIDRLAL